MKMFSCVTDILNKLFSVQVKKYKFRQQIIVNYKMLVGQ